MAEADPDPTPKAPIATRAARAVQSFRWWFVVPLPLAVILLNALSSPDGWREPYVRLVWLSWAVIVVAFVHITRKALFNYLDMGDAWDKLMQSATGAGLGFLGVCLVIAALLLTFGSLARAQDVRTYIPEQARPLLADLRTQQVAAFPDFPMPSYFGALIEQESCIGLKHSKCWNSRAQLKTAREEGAGLGQFTRAYRADGTLRFDAIEEVRRLDPSGLAAFTWQTVYTRPELSMRAILVKVRDCYRRLEQQTDAIARELVAMCDAAYNGGMGGLLQDRQLCALAKACDANVWFANIERTSTKSREKWQGYGKSAFEINREHVSNVLILRRAKYIPALGADLI